MLISKKPILKALRLNNSNSGWVPNGTHPYCLFIYYKGRTEGGFNMSKKDAMDFYGDLLGDGLLFDSTRNPKKQTFDPEDGDMFVTVEEMQMMQSDPENPNTSIVPMSQFNDPEDAETVEVFHMFNAPRVHKYTETEMAEIEASCETTIVHDYGDGDKYHLSDEEVAENDALNEIRMKLDLMTKSYRQIDKYIIAMRTIMEAWTILEEKYNYIHSKEEFFSMVSDGTIYSTGLIVPRMRGLDRYNLDLIIKYISNPELDPTDLVSMEELKKRKEASGIPTWLAELVEETEKTQTEPEEDIDTMASRVLDEDEQELRARYIENPDMELPSMKVSDLKYKYVKGYDSKNIFSTSIKKKKKKKSSKQDRFTAEHLHPLLRKIQRNPDFRAGDNMYSTALITNSLFERPEKPHDIWDDFVYKGSWANEAATELFDIAVDEELRDQHPLGDHYMTYRDKELLEFFHALEEMGDINVAELRRRMNSTDEDIQQKKIETSAHSNKKAESALLQRIIKLNNNPKFKKLIGKAEKALNKPEDTDY